VVRRFAIALLCIVISLLPSIGQTAESGPRAYGNAPTGLNVLQLVYSHSEAKGHRNINTDAGALYYYRYFSFFGKTALAGGFIPYADAKVSIPNSKLQFNGKGMGDPTAIIGLDFFGAPALDKKEFHHFRQQTIVGGSLQISMPLGRYDATSALNIGSNRWRFKPEIAVSQAFGRFVFDIFGNYYFFTDNKNFHAGLVKEQEGLWGIESHLSYTLMRGAWISADYFRTWGGETVLNGVRRHDRVRDSMIGTTLKIAFSPAWSIQTKYRHVIVSQSSSKTRSLKLKLQYLW